MTEDKMFEWHHLLKGHEFEKVLGDGEGQTGKPGVLHHKESDITE